MALRLLQALVPPTPFPRPHLQVQFTVFPTGYITGTDTHASFVPPHQNLSGTRHLAGWFHSQVSQLVH